MQFVNAPLCRNQFLELQIENSNLRSEIVMQALQTHPQLMDTDWMADNAFSADVACLLQKSSYIFFSFDSNHCCSCFFGSIIAGAHTYNCFVWVFQHEVIWIKSYCCSDNTFKTQHALSLGHDTYLFCQCLLIRIYSFKVLRKVLGIIN